MHVSKQNNYMKSLIIFIINRIKNVFNSDFNKNVIALAFGTTMAQIITYVSYPIVSRLYTPQEFGLFGLFTSIAGMITLISTGRYELAIVLPSLNKNAFHLMILSFFINFFVVLFVLIILFALSFFNFQLMGDYQELNNVIFLIPLYILLAGANNIFQNWYIRSKNFKLLSFSKVLMSIINNSIIIIAGLISIKLWGLFIGFFISITSIVIYFAFKFYEHYKKNKAEIGKKNLRLVARQYIDFPKANTLHALSDLFQSQGLVYFIAIFYSATTVGLYTFAIRVLYAPIMLLVGSFTQVFYQRASEMFNSKQSLNLLLKNTVLKVLAISIPIMIILLLFAEELFALIFSEEWRYSGIYTRILAPWICIDFVRYTIAQMPLILGKVKQVLFWSLSGNLLIIIVMFFSHIVGLEVIDSFIILSSIMTVYVVCQIIWIFKITYDANSR